MEVNLALSKPKDERKFEGGVLAQVIADKLNGLLLKIVIDGYDPFGLSGGSDKHRLQEGVEVETMKIRWGN